MVKVGILANHYPVAAGRYAADALRRLGCAVETMGPAHGRRVWGLELPAAYEWTPSGGDGLVDLLIVMDTDPALLDHPAVQALSVPKVVWTVDNHVRDVRRPWFDHYFLAHKAVSLFEWPANATHLPCAYDPIWFTPSPIPYAERAYDVCMIGVMYPQRWAIVEALRARGLRVLAGTGLVYEAYRDAYHNSRVALNISACGDLGQRVFETAALGCAVVTDPVGDLEAVGARGLHGLGGMAVEEIIEVVVGGEMWIAESLPWVKPHTWDERAKEVLAWARSHI